jgi:cation transport ATPase
MSNDRWIFLYLVGGILAVVSWLAHLLNATNDLVATLPAVLAALLLGSKLFYAAGQEVLKGRVSSSSLAALAILASMAVEKYGTAAFLAFILLIADIIVSRTADGAKRAIEQLVSLTPDIARVLLDGAEKIIPVGQVQVGQTVRIRPGENLPVDGRVISGESTINQASLTGEPTSTQAPRTSQAPSTSKSPKSARKQQSGRSQGSSAKQSPQRLSDNSSSSKSLASTSRSHSPSPLSSSSSHHRAMSKQSRSPQHSEPSPSSS